MVLKNAPLIIAGDFNDCKQEAGHILFEQQHLQEVFKAALGGHARSFSFILAMLSLHRIYTRGFSVEHFQVHSGFGVANLSDHAALTAHFVHI